MNKGESLYQDTANQLLGVLMESGSIEKCQSEVNGVDSPFPDQFEKALKTRESIYFWFDRIRLSDDMMALRSLLEEYAAHMKVV